MLTIVVRIFFMSQNCNFVTNKPTIRYIRLKSMYINMTIYVIIILGGGNMADIKVYTLNDIEKMLDVSLRTLYRYIDSGRLKANKIGNKWIVTESNLKEFIEGKDQ